MVYIYYTLEKLQWINLIYNQPGVDKKKTPMNRSTITQECEAANCFSPAEVQIEVKVGQAGSISLSLCNDCVRKFSDDNETH